jgi:hypothetical protein
MSSPRYTALHTAKEEIRLLTILPGRFDQNISCLLDHASLTSPPTYIGLSYCWGSDVKESKIVVNQETVLITQSLHSALLYIRKVDTNVVLWADALCINQNDLTERGEQVSMMDKIYKGGICSELPLERILIIFTASHVWVWLGESGDDSDIAMELVRSIDSEHFEDPDYTANPVKWTAVASLLQRPWFTRVWVIQEALLARTASIHCGIQSAMIEQLAHFQHMVSKYGVRYSVDARLAAVRSIGTNSPFQLFLGGWEEYKKSAAGGGLTLQGLLAYTGTAVCKDARDKIYGLLGMCQSFDRQNIKVDYNITARQLFVRVTAHLLQRKWLSSPYSILQPHQEDKNLDLPSWVPDFTLEDQESHLIYRVFNPTDPSSSAPYRAAATNVAWHRLGITYGVPDAMKMNTLSLNTAIPRISSVEFRETLTATGLKFDVVSYASQTPVVPYYKGVDMAEDARVKLERRRLTIAKANEWWKHVQSLPPGTAPYSATRDHEEAFWRTLVTDNDFDLRGPPDSGDFLGRFRAWMRSNDSSNDSSNNSKEEYWRPYNNQAVWCCIKRSFLTTERGYMGLGPSRTQAGDLVCILKGALVPFVVRIAQNDSFTFLGEAYVHGIMNGEFVLESHEENVCIFHLR